MGKNKKTVSAIHAIKLREGTLPGFNFPQFRIDVDAIYIGDYLNKATNSNKFDRLLPPLQMYSKRDEQKAAELVESINIWLPILVCSDDMDFSCIVVSAYVTKEEDAICWKYFGIGMFGEEPIDAPALYFDANEYQTFVKEFQRIGVLDF